MKGFTIFVSGSESTIVPRALRMNLLERLIMPWRLPAACTLARPVAVTLNRFLAADFVFSLGILLLLMGASAPVRWPGQGPEAFGAATACPAGRLERRGLIAAVPQKRNHPLLGGQGGRL